MRRILSLSLVLALGVVAAPARPQELTPPTPESDLETGVRQVADGDLQAAIGSLDAAVRGLAVDPVRHAKQLSQGYLYRGVAFVGLGQEENAKGSFAAALQFDKGLRITEDQFSPRVVRVFEAAREGKTKSVLLPPSTVAKKAGIGALAIAGIVGGALAIGGGVAVAGRGSDTPNTTPPSSTLVSQIPTGLTINVNTPGGIPIAGVTTVTLTGSATDPGGQGLTWSWDLGDGTTASGQTVTHKYNKGSFTTVLTVTNRAGSATARSSPIEVGSLTGVWRVSGQDQGFNLTQAGTSLTGVSLRGSVTTGTVTGGRVSDPRSVRFGFVYTNGNYAYDYSLDVSSDLTRMTGTETGQGRSTPVTLTR